MESAANSIYENIAARTGGDVYIGVVGPVRTGKSTFVKRMMEVSVIPHIDNIYQKERAKDELPQSGSGRTITTSEPKFIPEDAVKISPDGVSVLSVRLIDSVGYVIPSALGAQEEGSPRMITTPWFDEEIPLIQAAELGTKKIMDEHATVGLVITTDGTIHDIPREDFVEAEDRAIKDMIATGKPFLVLVNSAKPSDPAAKSVKETLETKHGIECLCVNCMTMDEDVIQMILSKLLYEFPLTELQLFLPKWISALTDEHPTKDALYRHILKSAECIDKLSQSRNLLEELDTLDAVDTATLQAVDLRTGILQCSIGMKEEIYYTILSEISGFSIENDSDLLLLLSEMSQIKQSYDKISAALDDVQATGYGIVMPTPDEMHLEVPQIVRKGSNYGVRLKASAPSIHMLRADIETEINPIVGDETQSQELLQYIIQEYEDDTEKLWQSNIFGKSVYELINEGLSSKLKRIPYEARSKLQTTLSRLINEDSSGLLCVIIS